MARSNRALLDLLDVIHEHLEPEPMPLFRPVLHSLERHLEETRAEIDRACRVHNADRDGGRLGGVTGAKAAEGLRSALHGPRPCDYCDERAGYSQRGKCHNCGAPMPSAPPAPKPIECVEIQK